MKPIKFKQYKERKPSLGREILTTLSKIEILQRLAVRPLLSLLKTSDEVSARRIGAEYPVPRVNKLYENQCWNNRDVVFYRYEGSKDPLLIISVQDSDLWGENFAKKIYDKNGQLLSAVTESRESTDVGKMFYGINYWEFCGRILLDKLKQKSSTTKR